MTKLEKLNAFARKFEATLTAEERPQWFGLDAGTRKAILASAFFANEIVEGRA